MPSRGGLVDGDGDDDSKSRSELQEHTGTKKDDYIRHKEQDDIMGVELLDGYTNFVFLENYYYGLPLHPVIPRIESIIERLLLLFFYGKIVYC